MTLAASAAQKSTEEDEAEVDDELLQQRQQEFESSRISRMVSVSGSLAAIDGAEQGHLLYQQRG